ncbi:MULTISPECIES: LysR family transcriptional regulator [unclassified Marinobacter]|jgi:DNA-binding transcriptional LysR family regulator|uniref:LysR family transcriptional regulator n=1 Tax=unclassified Marinobacter TaxID=83889 RepID=UPI00200BE399|nr:MULTISPECIES: LysR family transcriptional regulator [unclassified Marinobacter]UQG55156.1 LysR family transcriptional regulator [Marinobacter sp. M4C]UQG63958.1 LysR family transcriptional regulator [Marinobacter sp. M2C]UQG68241.1 LysR family transcriptional regulator [Marinobacter sp. M1C]
MNLRQLETFYWAARLGSFSAAAERLHATQSTVSMRIRELEHTMGMVLFDRSKRRIQLTAKGRELVDYANRILDLEADIKYRISSSDTLTGSLRLGVAEMISITWLPTLVKSVSKRYPKVRLEIDEGLTGDLLQGLSDGHLDLLLVPGNSSGMNVRTYSLGHVSFAWFASPTLGLGTSRHTPQSLSEWPVIGLKSASFHHAGIEHWFRHANVRCRYFARCKSLGVVASMASAGLGIAYLPIHYHSGKLPHVELEKLQTTDPLPPVEFVAALSVDEPHGLANLIAELAVSASDFYRTGCLSADYAEVGNDQGAS